MNVRTECPDADRYAEMARRARADDDWCEYLRLSNLANEARRRSRLARTERHPRHDHHRAEMRA